MQPRGPFQRQVRERLLQLPGLARLLEEVAYRRLDPFRLCHIDVVALLHGAHRALARILAAEATEHVVQQPLAHGSFGDLHLLDLELREHFREDRQTPGEHRAAILGDRLELQLAHVARLDAVLDGACDARRRDGE